VRQPIPLSLLASVLFGCGGASTSAVRTGTAAAAPSQSRPELLSLSYGGLRVNGASIAGWALRLRARDHGGRIGSVYFQQLAPPGGPGGAVVGACRFGGRRNGRVETITIPIGQLQRGGHRFRVTVEPCALQGHAQRSSRIFEIVVR